MYHGIDNLRETIGYFRQNRHVKSRNALYNRLQEYYPKNISYTEDIVKAFLGTVNAVEIPNGAGNILATQIHGLPVFYAKYPSISSVRWSDPTSSTPTSTFAFSLSWYTIGDKQTWDVPPTRTSLFPSWSWASVKTHRNLQKACGLGFLSYDDRGLEYEDLQAWVTFEDGERVELEDYIAGLEQYAKKTLAHGIYIRGWTTSLRSIATTSSGKSGNMDYATEPDYPVYQPSHDLSAIHLRSPLLRMRDDPEDRVDPVFLIVERVDGSTWRRVGLCKPRPKRYARGAGLPGIQDFLGSVDLKGAWGVRTDWEVRTLCLI
jgi:hypothetical protein